MAAAALAGSMDGVDRERVLCGVPSFDEDADEISDIFVGIWGKVESGGRRPIEEGDTIQSLEDTEGDMDKGVPQVDEAVDGL